MKKKFLPLPAFTCSNLTIETLEQVNFEHISHLVLVFLLLSLNMYLPAGMFQHAIARWHVAQ